ncbi:MAG: carboxypeptidase-like regulatory domain-containing protein [Saprospiraceae bacterium]|nr:carboxypeptidase-like regulatory domain-containing protein [Saprospiraceae bacterium]
MTYLSDKYHIIFSYNANLLEDNGMVVLKNERLSLKELLNEMFSDDQLLIITFIPNKIILQSKGPKLKVISVSGKVYDRDSGESIYGAVIYENHSNVSVLSNEKGYFTITLPKGKANIEVRYLGYKSSTITIDLDKPVNLTYQWLATIYWIRLSSMILCCGSN